MIPATTDVTIARDGHSAENCGAITGVMSLLGDKWTLVVVMCLAEGPMRFNDIKRKASGISQRMLTLTLRTLERDGFVTRTVFPTVPPRVDYELTALGQSLRNPVNALAAFAVEQKTTIERAREAFDGRTSAVLSGERFA